MKKWIVLSVLVVAGCIAEPDSANPVSHVGDSGRQDMGQLDLEGCEDCPADIEVEPEQIDLTVGGGVQVSVSVLNAQGVEVEEPELSWKSEAPETASVDDEGRITGVSEGETEVRVSSGMVEASIDVTVVGGQSGMIEVMPAGPVALAVGEHVDFTVSVTPENVECDVEYSLADSKIASVSGMGRVTGETAGTTNLRVACDPLPAIDVELEVTEFDPSLMERDLLQAWLRASDGIQTSGNDVTKWQGISAHERVFDHSNQVPPKLIGSAINNQPTVRFSTSQTLLAEGVASTREEVVVEDFTIFFVAKNNAPSTRGQLLSTCTSDEANNQQIRYNGSDDEIYMYGPFGPEGVRLRTDSATTEYQVLTLKRSGPQVELYQDGLRTDSVMTAESNRLRFSQIGARCRNEYLDGEIAEFLIFSAALDDSDQQVIKAYLSDRYGL